AATTTTTRTTSGTMMPGPITGTLWPLRPRRVPNRGAGRQTGVMASAAGWRVALDRWRTRWAMRWTTWWSRAVPVDWRALLEVHLPAWPTLDDAERDRLVDLVGNFAGRVRWE